MSKGCNDPSNLGQSVNKHEYSIIYNIRVIRYGQVKLAGFFNYRQFYHFFSVKYLLAYAVLKYRFTSLRSANQGFIHKQIANKFWMWLPLTINYIVISLRFNIPTCLCF